MNQVHLDRDRGIDALQRLVDEQVLTPAQLDAVRSALAEPPARGPLVRWWAEIAGYLGGALTVGGAALLLGTAWDRIADAGRTAILAGIAVALLTAASLVGGGPRGVRRLAHGASPVRRRVVATMLAGAAVAGAFAASVPSHDNPALAAGAVGLALAVGAYVLLPALPALAVAAVTAPILAIATLDAFDADEPLAVGLVFVAIGVAWLVSALAGLLVHRSIGLGVGAVTTLIGAQFPLGNAGTAVWAYVLTVAGAIAFFLLFRRLRVTILLVAGVIAAAVVAPEAAWDITNGAANAAVVLVVAGVALLGASAVGLGLWRGGHGGPPAAAHTAP